MAVQVKFSDWENHKQEREEGSVDGIISYIFIERKGFQDMMDEPEDMLDFANLLAREILISTRKGIKEELAKNIEQPTAAP